MKVVSTQLRMNEEFTEEIFFSIVVKWLKKDRLSAGVGGKLEQATDKGKVCIEAGYYKVVTKREKKGEANYMLFQSVHSYYEQTWKTELIFETRAAKKTVFVHVECEGGAEKFEVLPDVRSEVIREFVASGYILQEEFPVCCKPIEVTQKLMSPLAAAMKGEYRLKYPLVYISKILSTMGYATDSEEVARQLGGLAHVVVEPDHGTSLALKDLSGGANPFNGFIGIYYAGGKKEFIQQKRVTSLEIVKKVVRAVTANLEKEAPRYKTFYHEELEKRVRESKELEAEAIAENESLEEQLKRKNERIADLLQECERLKATKEHLMAAINAREGETLVAKASTQEWFEGEQHDLLVSIIRQARDNSLQGSRKHELLSSLLDTNKTNGAGERIFERIKTILSRGELTEKDFRELRELGLEVIGGSEHYKLLFKGDERYQFTIARTPSDTNWGKNFAADVLKKISVYK